MLPVENLSEEKANAYFADGVQDEILMNLGYRIADLKVISRTSVMQYRGGNVSTCERSVNSWALLMSWKAASSAPIGECVSMRS